VCSTKRIGRSWRGRVEAGFETVGELYNACKFRAALGEALALAREAAVAKQLPS
jgi:hypothetical protein